MLEPDDANGRQDHERFLVLARKRVETTPGRTQRPPIHVDQKSLGRSVFAANPLTYRQDPETQIQKGRATSGHACGNGAATKCPSDLSQLLLDSPDLDSYHVCTRALAPELSRSLMQSG